MKHANQMPQSPENDSYAVIASLAGPEMLDGLHDQLRSFEPVDFAMYSGAIRSTLSAGFGQMIESVGDYRPGVDKPTQLNIPATYASERAQANYLRSDVDIPRLAVVADLPERLNNSLGRVTLRNLGRYSVALSLVMAEKARSRASVVLADQYGATEIFDDRARESYVAMMAIDIAEEQAATPDGLSPLAEALTLTDNEIAPRRDVVVVVSDFMAGHIKDGEPDWQEPLEHLQASLDDRLLVIQLKSPAQVQLPVGLTDLPLDRLRAVQESYRETALNKAARISDALKYTRHVAVDAASKEVHPVSQIDDFLLG